MNDDQMILQTFRIKIVKVLVDSTHDDRIILLEVCMTTLGPYLPVLRENLLIYNGFRLVLARFHHSDYPQKGQNFKIGILLF